MRCANCAADNGADARFCAACGHPTRVHADERRVVTILFADLVGFTTLSEHLDPERVKRLVDVAFERLVHDVHEFGGRVDKIVGDAIVALFGAPVAHEDDAERAVRAALRMHETLAAYATEVDVDIRMRVGVNTGEVLVGALRAGGDYTAMGDVVNTASRLETSAAPGEVLVGAATHQATTEQIAYESRGSLLVRGRETPVDVWAATGTLRPPGYRSRRITPLVGRDTELQILRNLVELSIEHRRGQVIVLLGEAGVGKTRLANEIAPMVACLDPTVAVLNGSCVPYGEANPWWPIAEALRESCSIELDDGLDTARHKCTQAVRFVTGDERIDVTSIVTGLLHLMGYDGPLRSLDATRARNEAHTALYSFLEAGLRTRPVVIRLADLHWADQQVLDLIDDMTSRLARQPLVFVATARRGLLDRWSPRAGRQNSIVMNLEPLDREASAELLDTLLGADVPDHLRSMLLDRSGGNPFYLEELATLMGDRRDGGDDESEGAEEIPDTLRGLIAARIDALSSAEQMTLEDASVWGPSGPVVALRELGKGVRGDGAVDPVVQSLALKDIFQLDGDEWSFRSDVVREIAYARLTKAERLRRHQGIAEYLDAASGGRFIDDGFVDTVSRHFGESARLARELGRSEGAALEERAVRWLSEAARRADQAAAWPLAARLYDQVLDLTTREGESEDRLKYLLGRAHARNEMWNFTGAREDADEASGLAAELDDGVGAARIELLLGEIAGREGAYDESIGHFDRAVGMFDELDDLHGRAEALRLKGMAALFRNDAATAEEPIELSLDAFRAIHDRRGEAWALQNLAWIAFVTGRIGDAEDRLREAFDAFGEIGDQTGLAWTEGLLAFVRFYQGRFAEACELAERILVESQRRNDRWAQGMMLIVIGAVDLWEGRTERAVDIGGRAVGMFRSIGDATGLRQALALMGRALLMAGRVDEGLDRLDEASGGLALHEIGLENVMALGSSIAARVQLGIPQVHDPLEARAVLETETGSDRPAELAAAIALALAQAGEIEAARRVHAEDDAEALDASMPERGAPATSKVLNGYGVASRAVVLAAFGHHERVAAIAASMNADCTYLDLAMVRSAVGLGRSPSWLDDFAAAFGVVAETGDRVTKATVALARAHAAEAVGHDAAALWRDEAEAAWSELGVDPVGWRRVFALAASTPSATTPAGPEARRAPV